MKIINTATFDADAATELERLCVYNGLDCCLTQEIKGVLQGQMDKYAWSTYRYQMALQGPVLDMMFKGILIDLAKRNEMIRSLERKQERCLRILNKLAIEVMGSPLNPASPKQCQELFYGALNLPPIYPRGKKKGKNPTTDNEALEKLKAYFFARPFCHLIITYRDLGKLLGSLKAKLGPGNRMFGKFSVAGTETGRFSASKSNFGEGLNLQNQTERVKRMYVADPGMKLAYIDLEQAESRIVGLLCYALFGEANYLNACEAEDLHTTVCRMVWPQLPWTGDIKKDRRTLADQIFFRHFSYRDMAKRGGHGCLTPEHEVLTPEGWVSIAEKPPVIMAYAEGALQWDSPSNWVDKEWEGNLVTLQGRSVSCAMTPDHRVVFTRDTATEILREEPAEAFSSKGHIPLGQRFSGSHHEPYAELIAAYQCDGYQKSRGIVEFHFKKERKFQRLEMLAKEANIPYERRGDKAILHWHCLYDKEAGSYLLSWDRVSLYRYLEEHRYWDGHTGKTGSVSISSVSRAHLEWLQTAGRLVGIGGNIQKPRTSGFGSTVYTLQQNNRRYATKKAIEVGSTPYRGRVYCPTVNGGAFLIRHQGKISVTGNSNYYGKPPAMARNLNVDQIVMEGFQAAYFSAFPEIPEWHEWTRTTIQKHGQLITPFGRKRIFFSRTDQDSTLREAIAYIPQSAIGDLMNLGMYKVWQKFPRTEVQLLAQVHDAILIQYPEDREDEIIPEVLATIPHPLYARDREVIIPCEAETGFNWAKYDPKKKFYADGNPDGLKEYKGHDSRERTEQIPTQQSLLASTTIY